MYGEQIRLDRTLLALAHPARRAMMQRLSGGEIRITTLAKPFSMSLNAVSKHVRVLERARLVRRRRVGREHLLSLNPKPLDEAASWMMAQRKIWTKRLDTLESLLLEDDATLASDSRVRGSR
jgi:DNA-binding transcriptional ArsR family regulator